MKKHGKEAQWYSNAELMFADTSALLAGHVCCCNKSQLYTTDPAPTNTSISTTHIASSTRQAKPYQPAARTIRKTSARSYHPRSSCLTALATT